MTNTILLLPVIIPLVSAIIVLITPGARRGIKEGLALLATFANVVISLSLFGKEAVYFAPWAGFGISFSLKLYHFSAFTISAVAIFGFLITLYSTVFLADKNYSKFFYAYFLASMSFITGAALSNNLILMLFFWEGLLLTQFGMIALGSKTAFKTTAKALIIMGLADLCMMVGVAMTGNLAGTFEMSKISVPIFGLGGVAFLMLMIGAIAKGGSMPFHSWIPDAAIDAPLPFMAIFPAALEKLLSIYFLTRISIDMFRLTQDSRLSYALMTIGGATIILAVMMALIQKDFKRLLSYHAISQLGYMILGIGTCTPAGIVGGLFHMINNAMYKSCLFLTGGAVEKEAGTTDLEKLGGIGKKMPVTFACFIITALAISGVPPFNGFFSKELVYDGALERGMIFYLAAVAGSFFTAASFLKLGHAAFLGKLQEQNKRVREVPSLMLVPMILIAASCIFFGVYNAFPLNVLIQPILGDARLGGHGFAGFPASMTLVIVTVAVLIGALLNHIYGVWRTGKALGAADHIHYAPGLSQIYGMAEKGYLDPYNIWWTAVNAFSAVASSTDRAIDWFYNVFFVKLAAAFSATVRCAHDGRYKSYILWSLGGAILILVFLIKSS